MKEYVKTFAKAYVLLSIAIAAFVALFEIKRGGSFSIAVILASTFVAAHRFSKKEHRLPTAEETKSFAKLALASIWAISIALVVIYLAVAMPFSQLLPFLKLFMGIGILYVLLFVVVMSAISYFAIRWSFMWYCKRT